MAEFYPILPGARAGEGRRGGGRQQGLEPDAHGAGRPAGAACFRAADDLAPARRTGTRSRAAPGAGRGHREVGGRHRPRIWRGAPAVARLRALGRAVSMPGMMETVLDVGLNAETVEGLIRMTGNPRLAWDSYRRLVQGYAEVVADLPTAPFDALVAAALKQAEAESERELDHRDLRALTAAMLDQYEALTGGAFPADPREQLAAAAAAVFRSWDAPKAASYRRLNGISDEGGTAVTVQTMVYGNAGRRVGRGRRIHPQSRHRRARALLRFPVQRAGRGHRRRTPASARQRATALCTARRLGAAERRLPASWRRWRATRRISSSRFNPARLYLLQTRRAKRTDWAALTIAVDMVEEGLLTPAKALALLNGDQTGRGGPHELRPRRAPPWRWRRWRAWAWRAAPSRWIPTRSSARPRRARPSILVRQETVTTDIEGMALAAGILTGYGRAHLTCGGRGAPTGQGLPRRVPELGDRFRPSPVPDRRDAPERGRFLVAGRQWWRRLRRAARSLDGTAGTGAGRHRRLAPRRGVAWATRKPRRKTEPEHRRPLI